MCFTNESFFDLIPKIETFYQEQQNNQRGKNNSKWHHRKKRWKSFTVVNLPINSNLTIVWFYKLYYEYRELKWIKRTLSQNWPSSYPKKAWVLLYQFLQEIVLVVELLILRHKINTIGMNLLIFQSHRIIESGLRRIHFYSLDKL
jgi:hypothetical protein